MRPQLRLTIATSLMLLASLPLLFGIYTIFAFLDYGRRHQGEMGGSDTILMLSVFAVCYLVTLTLGGAAALWAAVLASRNEGLRTGSATFAAIYLAIVLALPIILSIAASVFDF